MTTIVVRAEGTAGEETARWIEAEEEEAGDEGGEEDLHHRHHLPNPLNVRRSQRKRSQIPVDWASHQRLLPLPLPPLQPRGQQQPPFFQTRLQLYAPAVFKNRKRSY